MSALFLAVTAQLLTLNNTFCGNILFGSENGVDITKDAQYLANSNSFWRYKDEIIPFFIGLPTCEKGIQDLLSVIRCNSIPFRVRSVGHHYFGYSKCNGLCLVIDLRHFKKIEIKMDTFDNSLPPIATVGVGVTSGELTDKLIEYSAHDRKRLLTFPVGNCATVGIGGYIQTGGHGQLFGATGFAADYLISARVVTANGDVIEVSDTNHKDLLYGLRGGGGGNFGIATQYKLRTIQHLPTKKFQRAHLFYAYTPQNLIEIGLAWNRILIENNYGNGYTIAILLTPTIESGFKSYIIEFKISFISDEFDFDDFYADILNTINISPVNAFNITKPMSEAYRDGFADTSLAKFAIPSSRLSFKPMLTPFWNVINKGISYFKSNELLLTVTIVSRKLGSTFDDKINMKTAAAYRESFALILLFGADFQTNDHEKTLNSVKNLDFEMSIILETKAVPLGLTSLILNDDDYEMAYYETKQRYKKLQDIKCKYDPNAIFQFENGIKTKCSSSKSSSKSSSASSSSSSSSSSW